MGECSWSPVAYYLVHRDSKLHIARFEWDIMGLLVAFAVWTVVNTRVDLRLELDLTKNLVVAAGLVRPSDLEWAGIYLRREVHSLTIDRDSVALGMLICALII